MTSNPATTTLLPDPGPAEVVTVAGWDDASVEFPVLAGVPELGAMLESLRQVDRLIASAIDSIIRLQDAEVAETATGVPLEQWLLLVARRTATDRRMLLTCAEVCRRLPGLLEAFVQGKVSWSQVRTLVLQVMRLPRATDEQLDAALAELIVRNQAADPDRLGHLARFIDRDHGVPARGDNDPDGGGVEEFLALQPRLDGSGGRFFGEAGPASFAVLENATNPGPPKVATGRRIGATTDGETARRVADSAGRRRLQRLIDLLDHTCHDPEGSDGGDNGRGDTGRGGGGRSRPTLLVVADLDTLCNRNTLPARLLHHLAGGRMYLNAAAARRLIDQRGADLRTIILDDTGQVVGIGRRHRVPPGWLTTGCSPCTTPVPSPAARPRPCHARPTTHVPGTPHDPATCPDAPTSTTSHRCARRRTAPKRPTGGPAPKPPTAPGPGDTNAPAWPPPPPPPAPDPAGSPTSQARTRPATHRTPSREPNSPAPTRPSDGRTVPGNVCNTAASDGHPDTVVAGSRDRASIRHFAGAVRPCGRARSESGAV